MRIDLPGAVYRLLDAVCEGDLDLDRERMIREIERSNGLPYGVIRRRPDDETPAETALLNQQALQRLFSDPRFRERYKSNVHKGDFKKKE